MANLSNQIDRRAFLTGTAATLAGSLGVSQSVQPAAATATEADSSRSSTFGYPIEEEWQAGDDVSRVRLGSITGDRIAASFISTGEYTTDSRVGVLDRNTGTFVWETEVSSYVFGPYLRGDFIYYTDGNRVVGQSTTDESERWTHATENRNTIPLTVSDTHVYVVDYREQRKFVDRNYVPTLFDATLTALERENGSVAWRARTDRMFWYPQVQGETLYVRSNFTTFEDNEFRLHDGTLYAYDATTGDLDWETEEISLEAVTATENGVVVPDTEDALYGYSTDGTRRWQRSGMTGDYFVFDDTVVATEQGGGITVLDLEDGSTKGDSKVTGTPITDIDVDPSEPRVYLGTPNGILALSTDDYSQVWQTTLPAKPDSVYSTGGIVCVRLANYHVSILDAATGEEMWSKQYFSDVVADAILSTRVVDGVVYVSGENIGVQAISGARYRTHQALSAEKAASGSLTGTVANVFDRQTLLSRAEVAFEDEAYAEAQQLITKAQRRHQAVQAAVGITGLGAAYGTSRKAAARRERNALRRATDSVTAQYPVSTGSLKGAEPQELVAQARTAQEALSAAGIDSLWTSIQGNTEYATLTAQLNGVSERRETLSEISETIAAQEAGTIPNEWVTDLRTAIDKGDIETIDSLTAEISTVDRLVGRFDAVRRLVRKSSLPVADVSDNFYALLAASASANSESATEGTLTEREVQAYISASESALEAYNTNCNTLDAFDLGAIEDALTTTLEPDPSTLTEATRTLKQVAATLQAASTAQKHIEGINFTVLEAERDEYVTRVQGLLAQLAAGQLDDLASELEQIRHGRWETSDLFTVSHTGFEHVVGALFADMGYESYVTEETADKGVDVIARNGVEVLAIQVKQYDTGNAVGRPTVQQMVGAMAQAGADRAVIVTTSGFTATAVEAANALGDVVTLIDRSTLVEMLTESSLSPPTGTSHAQYKNYHKTQTRQSNERSSGRTHHRSTNDRDSSSQSRNSTAHGMSKREAYAVLEVSSSASVDEIKQAYRERVKQTHPDSGTGGGDVDEFKRVKEAYNLLTAN